jgi:YegS/Rv2252/BmrU family lipid kinase
VTIAIANPRAGGGRVERGWVRLAGTIRSLFGEFDVRFTRAPGDATAIARTLVEAGQERLIVIGGDGTLNEVVNGCMVEGRSPTVIPFPVGTGGDFGRSIGLAGGWSKDAVPRERMVDVGRVELATGTHYFINICSFGASGIVVDTVNRSSKRYGGKVAFFLGTMRSLVSYQNQPVSLRLDGQDIFTGRVNTVVVANGQYFGGSMRVAPGAAVDDGLFDVVVMGDTTRREVLAQGLRIYAGTHVELPKVQVFRGQQLEATPLGKTPVLIDLDGEQPGRLPARFQILPARLRIVTP